MLNELSNCYTLTMLSISVWTYIYLTSLTKYNELFVNKKKIFFFKFIFGLKKKQLKVYLKLSEICGRGHSVPVKNTNHIDFI